MFEKMIELVGRGTSRNNPLRSPIDAWLKLSEKRGEVDFSHDRTEKGMMRSSLAGTNESGILPPLAALFMRVSSKDVATWFRVCFATMLVTVANTRHR